MGAAETSKPLIALGVGLIATILAGLALYVPGEPNIDVEAFGNVFVGVLAVAAALYLAAVVLVARRHRLGIVAILLVAVAMRLGPLLAPPFLSSDMYRYVWDGRVQIAGINPYLYVPVDPALASLRDDTIYPNINRADYARTIYPPVAQMFFQAVGRISSTVPALKLAMVLAEFVGMACVVRLLSRAGLPRERLLIYAWNPLAVWDYAGNGHVDALAIGLVGLALLARGMRRDGWAGLALGAAVLVKFLPAAIAPALWRRWGWRMPVACLAVIAAGYAAYSGAGSHVLGFLGTYTREEDLAQGSGFWVLAGLGEFGPLPAFAVPAYLALAVILLGGLAAVIAFRLAPRVGEPPPPDDIVRVGRWTAILAASTMFAVSPHYPWYFPWLALPSCLCPLPSVVFFSVAPLLLYLDPLHERFIWAALLYVPLIVLAARDLAVARLSPSGSALHVRPI